MAARRTNSIARHHVAGNRFYVLAARVYVRNIVELLFITEKERNQMNGEAQGRKMSQLIAKCWADEGFKRKLLADPAATLKAEGAELPAGLSIKALADDDKVFHLVIPARPTELSDEDLAKVAGGGLCEIPTSLLLKVSWLGGSSSGRGSSGSW